MAILDASGELERSNAKSSAATGGGGKDMSNANALDTLQRITLQYEVEEFLKYEAYLLDERRYDEWINLLADEIHYWMPIRRTTTAHETDYEFTKPGAMAFFDDDKEILTKRVHRLQQDRAWAEDPPSRTRHSISNVRITDFHEDEVSVSLNFHLYRTRMESEEDSWIGRREDVLKKNNGNYSLAKRHIFLEQTVILSQNLSSIF